MTAVLELRSLHKSYDEHVVLRDLDLAVHQGEVVGLLGSNGAGKTTAMRIALGLIAPDAGEVVWRGKPSAPHAVRHFGYLPEERGLYPRMRLDDQLRYLARLHGLPADHAARAVAETLELFGLTSRARDRLETLSLGNQQRVQLAAALVHDPELLILDEPFSGLDPVGMETLTHALLKRAERGAPVIFSSHQLDQIARTCETIAILHGGRAVVRGRLTDLCSAPHRVRVTVRSFDHDDVLRLPGVRAVTSGAQSGGSWDLLVELEPGVPPSELLTRLVPLTAVERFTTEDLTLAEVYRAAVAS